MGGALAIEAQRIYESLSPNEQEVARRVFIGLVQLGEGTQDTRRRTIITSLTSYREKPAHVKKVIECFADQKTRLISLSISDGNETAEVSHEALLENWEQLREWLENNREDIRFQRRLEETTQLWDSNGRPEGSLWRSPDLNRLEEFYDKAEKGQNALQLTDLQKAFYQAALDAHEQEHQSILQKEKQAKKILLLSGVIGFLGLTSVGLGGLSIWSGIEIHKSQIKNSNTFSKAHLASNKEVDALIESIKAGNQIQEMLSFTIPSDLHRETETQLQQVLRQVSGYRYLKEHPGGAYTVSYSPDGRFIATGGVNGKVNLWNTISRKLENDQIEHKNSITDIAFSPTNSQIVASASEDGEIKVWDINTGKKRVLGKQPQENRVSRITFSPNGKIIASVSSESDSIILWPLKGKEKKYQLNQHRDKVSRVAFSPDGEKIASASINGKICLWKLEGDDSFSKPIFPCFFHAENKNIRDISFSKNSKTIASSSADGTVKLWNLDNAPFKDEPSKVFDDLDTTVNRIIFSPDSKTLATANEDNTIKLLSIEGQELHTLQGHNGAVKDISISPDNRSLVSVSLDQSVRLWDLNKLPLKQTFINHSRAVEGLDFDPNNHAIVSASNNETIIWHPLHSDFLILNENTNTNDILFHPKGRILFSANEDAKIKFWDIKNFETKPKILLGHEAPVNRLSYSHKDELLASASDDGTVRFWDMNGAEVLKQPIKAHSGEVYSVSFSPRGKILASAGEDRTVKLWSTEGKQLGLPLKHDGFVFDVSFSPNGQLLASASTDKKVRLWNIDNLKDRPLCTFEGHEEAIFDVSFSPDERFLASASADQTVKIWRLNNCMELQTLKGHRDGVSRVHFHPDPKKHILASASWDGTVKLWAYDHDFPMNLNEILTDGCQWLKEYWQNNPIIGELDRRSSC